MIVNPVVYGGGREIFEIVYGNKWNFPDEAEAGEYVTASQMTVSTSGTPTPYGETTGNKIPTINVQNGAIEVPRFIMPAENVIFKLE